MSTGSRENKQNKVRTQLWDTLYIISRPLHRLEPAHVVMAVSHEVHVQLPSHRHRAALDKGSMLIAQGFIKAICDQNQTIL